jgi:hypothetical protein
LLFISAFAHFGVLCSFFAFVFCFVLFCFCLGFSYSFGHLQSNFPIGSHRVVLSSLSPDSFFANCPIPDVLRSNASPEPNWRTLFHAPNSASESDPANVTAQEGGNASPAMNDVFSGTTTNAKSVTPQARASTRVNSESVSNEIDESDLQSEKQSE